MPTNAQRFGTKNLPLNLPVEYIRELGKAAFATMKRSRTQLVIELMEAGAALKDPALAKKLVAIRQQFYAAPARRSVYALCLLFVFALPVLAHDPRGLWRVHRPVAHKAHALAKGKFDNGEPEPIEV